MPTAGSTDSRAEIILRWLIRLRWGAVAGQLVVLAVARTFVETPIAFGWLLFLVGVLAFSNVFLALTRDRVAPRLLCGGALTFEFLQLSALVLASTAARTRTSGFWRYRFCRPGDRGSASHLEEQLIAPKAAVDARFRGGSVHGTMRLQPGGRSDPTELLPTLDNDTMTIYGNHMSTRIKTTVYLTESEYRRLKELAREQHRPTAELVREAVAEYARRHGERRLPQSIGAGDSGRGDLSERAEELLDGMGQ